MSRNEQEAIMERILEHMTIRELISYKPDDVDLYAWLDDWIDWMTQEDRHA